MIRCPIQTTLRSKPISSGPRKALDDYIQGVDGELYIRGLKLSSAIDTFRGFLELPDTKHSRSVLLPIINIAFGALTILQPELLFAGLLAEEVKAAELALAISKKAMVAAPKAARVVKGAEDVVVKGTKEIKEGLKKGQTVGKSMQSIQDLVDHDAPAPPKPDQRLKGIIDEENSMADALADVRQNALSAWDSAYKALLIKYYLRLKGFEDPSTGSLAAFVRGLLKPPTPFTKSELEQLSSFYAYQLIGQYVRDNVQIKREVVYDPNEGTSSTYDDAGLNDNQQEMLVDLFGFTAQRGKVFSMPPIRSALQFLVAWKCKTVTHNTRRPMSARNDAMTRRPESRGQTLCAP